MAKTVKRTEPKEPTITVQARSDEATWSADDIIAKRLSGQPFGVRSDVIPMREPGKWALRVANSDVHESRHYDMTHKLGYLPVLSSDLAEGVTPESMGFRIAEDGQTLVKGPRGDSVLYKMPKVSYDKVQMAKAHANVKGIGSQTAARNDAAEAAGGALGSEAADYISKNTTMHIRDSRE